MKRPLAKARSATDAARLSLWKSARLLATTDGLLDRREPLFLDQAPARLP